MTLEFQQMLQLAAAGAAGHPVLGDWSGVRWDRVIRLARQQSVDFYLAYGLKNQIELPCPGEIRDPLIRDARKLAFSNAMHRSAIIHLLEKMEAAGIPGVLLKGYAIADCYAIPELRTCGDADIWINPKDERRACRFMKKNGFSVQPRWQNGHHAVCTHPTLGCVELHVILYDEIVEEIWFGKMDGSEFVNEPKLRISTQDGNYTTLGYTDHCLFLALHMIKHFIISGLTVQMMLDVALFMRKYANKIDFHRLWDTVCSLRYDRLLNSILWATVLYCGFRQEDFPGLCQEPPEQIRRILADLEDGGWMGYGDKPAREEGWQEYNRQIMLKNGSKLRYMIHMALWKMGELKTTLFPSANLLRQRFPYARKSPLLLIVAWFHRLIFRGTKAIFRGALADGMILDEEKINPSAKNRISLFRDLEML